MRGEIKECGAVKFVEINCLKRNLRKVEAELRRVEAILKFNYGILERVFLEQYRNHYERMFFGIEPILHEAFDRNNVPELKNECQLTFTLLGDKKYSMFIGPLQLGYFLQQFKLSDDVPGSPLELAITFIMGQGDDTFLYKGLLREDNFVALSIGELAEHNHNSDMLAAESILTRNRKLAVLEVCRVGGFSIQANISDHLRNSAIKPIRAVRKAITEQFEFNMHGSLAKRGGLALEWYKIPGIGVSWQRMRVISPPK